MKVVLDTNVLLAAFGTRGLCEALLTACLKSHEVILSKPILDELCRHLRAKFKVPAQTVNEIVGFLRSEARIVAPADVPADACRDADDLPVLGTALAGQADCLVSGDKDLLTLHSFRGIPILAPRAFYERLK